MGSSCSSSRGRGGARVAAAAWGRNRSIRRQQRQHGQQGLQQQQHKEQQASDSAPCHYYIALNHSDILSGSDISSGSDMLLDSNSSNSLNLSAASNLNNRTGGAAEAPGHRSNEDRGPRQVRRRRRQGRS